MMMMGVSKWVHKTNCWFKSIGFCKGGLEVVVSKGGLQIGREKDGYRDSEIEGLWQPKSLLGLLGGRLRAGSEKTGYCDGEDELWEIVLTLF